MNGSTEEENQNLRPLCNNGILTMSCRSWKQKSVEANEVSDRCSLMDVNAPGTIGPILHLYSHPSNDAARGFFMMRKPEMYTVWR